MGISVNHLERRQDHLPGGVAGPPPKGAGGTSGHVDTSSSAPQTLPETHRCHHPAKGATASKYSCGAAALEPCWSCDQASLPSTDAHRSIQGRWTGCRTGALDASNCCSFGRAQSFVLFHSLYGGLFLPAGFPGLPVPGWAGLTHHQLPLLLLLPVSRTRSFKERLMSPLLATSLMLFSTSFGD